jgi:hypothetical protein
VYLLYNDVMLIIFNDIGLIEAGQARDEGLIMANPGKMTV